MRNFIAILAMALVCSVATAQSRMYIDDNNQVPLRSGQSLEYRILHRGLPAGTPVEVLEQNEDSGYSRVRTQAGQEGWLLSRFLTPQPIARDRLQAAEKKLAQVSEKNSELTAQHKNLLQENKRLEGENARLKNDGQQVQEELLHIKRISENAVALDRRNQELQEQNQQLKGEVELLTAENQRLTDNADTDNMLIGAALVLLGVIIAVVLPWMRPRKKSSWA